jgi:hypothetical protein
VSKKERGRKWDGKSRVSNDTYRKRFNEITWKDMDEIARGIEEYKEENLNNEKKQ